MNWMVVISMGLISLYTLAAVSAWMFEGTLDYKTAVGEVHEPPTLSQGVWKGLGTDGLGRSVAKKLLLGVKASVAFGLWVAVGCVLLGIVFGILSGYLGGWVDLGITWLFTTLSAVPGILMLLAVMFVFGKEFWTAVAALVFMSWVGLCRMLRGEVMRERNRDYVLAARNMGASDARILLRHILPNVSHYIWIYFALYFIMAVKSEIILAFLGFEFVQGVSWGIIISDARGELLKGVWWPLAGATVLIAGLLLSLYVTADWLRDRLDPKMETGARM
jgi:peptide/nickel transport system permease protein